MNYPHNIEQKIAFDTIRHLLRAKSFSPLGASYIDNISFTDNPDTICHLLTEVKEMQTLLLTESDTLPTGTAASLTDTLHRIRPEGTHLNTEEALLLYATLLTARTIATYLLHRNELYPTLATHCQHLNLPAPIITALDTTFDRHGEIRDTASPTLATIRHSLRNAQSTISKTMNSILRQAQAEGYLPPDATPTLREGRLVLPIPPMHRRHILGIIHDTSATGKTLFIEPSAIVEANNHIRSLQADEEREINTILTNLTDLIRPAAKEILTLQHFLTQIDGIRAKALFAQDLNAISPQLQNTPLILWKEARHPLLQLTLTAQNKTITPLDITLTSEQRILLISGPNAGGKSVTLKTVALLQYMLQCGIPIPIHESSKVGIFSSIFIDIGDEQSIENSLSTYSSHLLNMKHFINHATPNTLILIDEFGTGTEPQIGGAIAEAILSEFNKKKTFGIITTHYTNLKNYAAETPGLVNGAMLYDRNLMQPLFKLQIGNPGSSFAIEIARKTGIPESVINTATEKAGTQLINLDKHLQDIVRDKRYWETKRQQIRIKEKQTQELLLRYEQELTELQKKQKTIIQEAKTTAEQILNNANATIENTIRQIKESQANREITKSARQQLNKYKESQHTDTPTSLDKKLSAIRQKLPSKSKTPRTPSPLTIGDYVRIKGKMEMQGTILSLSTRHAIIAIGDLKTKAPISQLERTAGTKQNVPRPTSIATQNMEKDLRQHRLAFHPDIDIRGMRKDEAISTLTHFIDDAQMLGVTPVRILHGTGDGILRTITHDYLKKQGISSFHDENVQFGGAGITVVEL